MSTPEIVRKLKERHDGVERVLAFKDIIFDKASDVLAAKGEEVKKPLEGRRFNSTFTEGGLDFDVDMIRHDGHIYISVQYGRIKRTLTLMPASALISNCRYEEFLTAGRLLTVKKKTKKVLDNSKSRTPSVAEMEQFDNLMDFLSARKEA